MSGPDEYGGDGGEEMQPITAAAGGDCKDADEEGRPSADGEYIAEDDTPLRPTVGRGEEGDGAAEGGAGSSDDELPDHPQLVARDGRGGRVWRKRRRAPALGRGGDSLSTKYSSYTVDLLIPVSVTMLLVVYAVENFTPIYAMKDQQPLYLAYNEKAGESTETKLEHSVVNAAVIVLFFVVITSVMVVLYKFRCTCCIYGWLIMSSAVILYFMGWIWFDLFCVKYQLPYDSVTCAAIMWNFGTVGVVNIYFYGHRKMAQAYLVATSAIMAWFLTRLPEWTTWSMLAAVALYDIYAVLAPYGPLKALVEQSQQRNEPLPGLLYESKSFKLGLGDFVFYSVLVGRSALTAYLPWATAALAVLSGLCGTLFCLGVFQKALPALPFSIFLGMAMYFLSRFLIMPWQVELSLSGGMV